MELCSTYINNTSKLNKMSHRWLFRITQTILHAIKMFRTDNIKEMIH